MFSTPKFLINFSTSFSDLFRFCKKEMTWCIMLGTTFLLAFWGVLRLFFNSGTFGLNSYSSHFYLPIIFLSDFALILEGHSMFVCSSAILGLSLMWKVPWRKQIFGVLTGGPTKRTEWGAVSILKINFCSDSLGHGLHECPYHALHVYRIEKRVVVLNKKIFTIDLGPCLIIIVPTKAIN